MLRSESGLLEDTEDLDRQEESVPGGGGVSLSKDKRVAQASMVCPGSVYLPSLVGSTGVWRDTVGGDSKSAWGEVGSLWLGLPLTAQLRLPLPERSN